MRWFGRPYMAMAPRFVIPTCSTSFSTILFFAFYQTPNQRLLHFISLSLFSSGQPRLLSLSLSLSLFFSHPLKPNSNTKISF
jgi:hypothetical protein